MREQGGGCKDLQGLKSGRGGAASGERTQTSGDLAHLRDGRVVGGDAAQLLAVGRGRPGQPQHQRKQSLVPAEGLLGQLAAGQRGVQGQVQLWEKGPLENRKGKKGVKRKERLCGRR